jgi:membrane protease YdiL (CAAX protease family)
MIRLAVRAGVYVLLYFAIAYLFGPLFGWVGGILVGVTVTGIVAGLTANAYALHIFEHRPLREIGFQWNRDSARNLGLGLAGGAGAASLAVLLPLVAGAASFRLTPEEAPSLGAKLFIPFLLLLGAAGEEILFRGYGFQLLLRGLGAYSTIVPAGVLFALLHAANPSAWDYKLGLVNTACFGILFGYAFLRSHDVWLPIGLHYGWNVTLPLFGVNVSGITMRLTGYALEWAAGPLWSGGEYGLEASILTTGLLVPLWFYVAKAPVRRQPNALLDAPGEGSNA